MNALATTSPKPAGVLASIAGRYQMDADAFKATVKGTVFPPSGTNEELAAFLMVANEYRLNPITREIYAFPKKGGGIVPIVSIDGWISLVNSHPKFRGMEFDAHTSDKGALLAYTCRIWRTDREMPTVITEYLDECIRGTEPWKMRHRMLRHKALIQCARYAFGFSGIYDEDEGSIIAEARDVAPRGADSRKAPAPPKQIAAPVIEARPDTPAKPQREATRAGETPAHDPETGEVDQDKAAGSAASEPMQESDRVTSGGVAPAEQQDQQDGGDRVPDYDGQALLAEFSEALDGFESIEAIDEWLGKTKGKPNRGMVIVEALNPGDQQEAREIYRQAKARIEDHAAAGQHDEQQTEERAAAPADDDGSDFPGDRPSPQQAIEKDPAQMNDAELEAYIRAWIEASTDTVVMKKRWFAEAELRDNLDPKVAGELRALWKKRSDELQPKA